MRQRQTQRRCNTGPRSQGNSWRGGPNAISHRGLGSLSYTMHKPRRNISARTADSDNSITISTPERLPFAFPQSHFHLIDIWHIDILHFTHAHTTFAMNTITVTCSPLRLAGPLNMRGFVGIFSRSKRGARKEEKEVASYVKREFDQSMCYVDMGSVVSDNEDESFYLLQYVTDDRSEASTEEGMSELEYIDDNGWKSAPKTR
jgi:hypothetical protein